MKVYNNRHNSQFKIGNGFLEQTTTFFYRESIVSSDGGCQEDIINRRNKAKVVFSSLLPIWNSKKLKLSTEIRIFNSMLNPFYYMPVNHGWYQ
jgi:hypothetical protein